MCKCLARPCLLQNYPEKADDDGQIFHVRRANFRQRWKPSSTVPRVVKAIVLGSGTAEGENWMLSNVQLFKPVETRKAENINSLACPAKEEMSAPYKV